QGNQPPDPLVPRTDSTSDSQSQVFDNSQSASASGQSQASPAGQPNTGSESGSPGTSATAQSSGSSADTHATAAGSQASGANSPSGDQSSSPGTNAGTEASTATNATGATASNGGIPGSADSATVGSQGTTGNTSPNAGSTGSTGDNASTEGQAGSLATTAGTTGDTRQGDTTPAGQDAGAAGQQSGTDSKSGSAAGDQQGKLASAGKTGTDKPGAADTGANGELNAQIQAAQAALEKAGIKLQQAGDAIAQAQTPEQVAAAGKLLAQARIMVIVTSQDLEDARKKMGAATPDQARVMNDAQKSLDNATVALVIAGKALLGQPDIDKPTAAGVPGQPSDNDKVGKLDDKLNHSLVVFDGTLNKARNAVVQPAPQTVVTAGDSGAAVEKLPQGPTDIDATGNEAGDKNKQKQVAVESSGGNSEGNAKMDKAKDEQVAMKIPEGVGNGQDDDIVAKQLREAAMAETDPKLRKKLWDEYKRYKAGM
ncbi:MAG TPA: hypothetical protein VJ998_11560, partial [Pseudomonadales bacterium]|nr:hypothetical protein [Pseudomonadales bacterium]